VLVNYNWYTYSEKLACGFRNCVNLCIVQSEKFYRNMVSYLCAIGQWRTQEFCFGRGSTNSVEDRDDGDLGAVAP